MDIWRFFAAKSCLKGDSRVKKKGAKKSFVHLLFFDGQESNFTCGRYARSCNYKTYAPCLTKADSDLLFHVCYLQEPQAPDLTHVITTEESWVERWLSCGENFYWLSEHSFASMISDNVSKTGWPISWPKGSKFHLGCILGFV